MILRDIPGWLGYAASDDGRIWSKPGKVGWYSSPEGRWLKPRETKRGYLVVALPLKGRKVYRLIHRLVALAWHANPDALPQINHIDGDQKNNRPDNVEWCTQSHNMRHAWATGLQVCTPAMRAATSKTMRAQNRKKRALTDDQVSCVRNRVASGERQYKIAQEFGVCEMTISKIVNWKTYVD